MPPERSLDIPSVVGFVLASAGAGALAIELMVRGWWGFATSGVDLLVVLIWLILSGGLCWWAFEHAEGWWQVLAIAGLVVSVVAVAALVLLLALRLLVEHPDAFTDDSNRKRKHRRSNRTRRRRSW